MAYVLVADLPDAQSPASNLSRSLPGVAMDFFVLAPQEGELGVARAVCEVSGGTAADRGRLMVKLFQADPAARWMDAPADCLRATLWFPFDRMAPSSRHLAQFCVANRLPLVWGRVEDGTTEFRFFVERGEELHALHQRLVAHLAAAGIEAQVGQEAAPDRAVATQMVEMERLLRAPPGGAPQGF